MRWLPIRWSGNSTRNRIVGKEPFFEKFLPRKSTAGVHSWSSITGMGNWQAVRVLWIWSRKPICQNRVHIYCPEVLGRVFLTVIKKTNDRPCIPVCWCGLFWYRCSNIKFQEGSGRSWVQRKLIIGSRKKKNVRMLKRGNNKPLRSWRWATNKGRLFS